MHTHTPHTPPPHSPLHHLHGDEVVAVSAVEEDEAVGRGGLELEEQVHGGVGLQRGQAQVAALGPEGHGVGDDDAQAEAGVQLAVVDVSVLAHVDVLHPVELQALETEHHDFMEERLQSIAQTTRRSHTHYTPASHLLWVSFHHTVYWTFLFELLTCLTPVVDTSFYFRVMLRSGVIMLRSGVIMLRSGVIMLRSGFLMLRSGVIMLHSGVIMLHSGF